jgi:hypothetical protein
MFFGADDNFFNDTQRTLDIVDTLASKMSARKRPLCKIRFGTEATVHDTIRLKEHLPTMRRAGLFAVWLGVEDMTATLIRKGQSEANTIEAFRRLRENGIFPVPMLIHSDDQPLLSWKNNRGLINQLRILRQSGALFAQVLMLVPAFGSKLYVGTYTSGMAFDQVNGVTVEPHLVDGNHVIASWHPRPWIKQLSLLVAYTYFFNPLCLLAALILPKSKIPFADADTSPAEEIEKMPRWKRILRRIKHKTRAHLGDAGMQLYGMAGLSHTYRRTIGWAWNLFRGKIRRATDAPTSRIPMRSVQGDAASHALPGTPVSTYRVTSTANGPPPTAPLDLSVHSSEP